MLVDSHTHLNFKAYDDDLSEVISRCQQVKMALINVGAALESSQKAVKLAQENQNFYASIGLHPIHVDDEEFNLEDYQNLINNNPNKIVAMGESGLDYFHNQETKEKQVEIFLQHIELAKQNNLALIVHGRNDKPAQHAAIADEENKLDVYQDIYNILKQNKVKRAVVHCFGGNLDQAKQIIELGLYLGFTGIITFDKTGVLAEIIKIMPLDKILIETDAPYLTPVPHRGKRNEPVYVKEVVKKISEIRNMSIEEVIEITGNNAIKLFNLK